MSPSLVGAIGLGLAGLWILIVRLDSDPDDTSEPNADEDVSGWGSPVLPSADKRNEPR